LNRAYFILFLKAIPLDLDIAHLRHEDAYVVIPTTFQCCLYKSLSCIGGSRTGSGQDGFKMKLLLCDMFVIFLSYCCSNRVSG
jgi:hypothetical protein